MDTETCQLCARTRTRTDAAGLCWSSQHDHDPEGNSTITWTCPTCTRAQLWLIEAGLPITGDFTGPALDRAA
jgi:hypothetical protein